MKLFACLCLLFAGLAPAIAAEPQPIMPTAPVVKPVSQPTAPAIGGRPGKLSSAQQQRAMQRLPAIKKQLEGLAPDEQRAVLRKAAPPRQKLTDAERDANRDARRRAAREAWAAKTPAQKAELRQKFLSGWQKLPPEERAYRRARMTEQLQALPEVDRKAVIAPFTPSNAPPAANAAPQP